MSELGVGASDAIDLVVQLAADGDQRAFGRLVDAHHGSMTRVAYVITGDPDAAQEAVQLAWTKAWRQLRDLRDRSQVRSWLIAIAANEARQAQRRGRRARVVDLSEHVVAPASTDPANAIDLVDLDRALQRLKPDERWLLALRFTAGLDSTEIAAHTGISASGVRSRLERVLARLRKDLDRG